MGEMKERAIVTMSDSTRVGQVTEEVEFVEVMQGGWKWNRWKLPEISW